MEGLERRRFRNPAVPATRSGLTSPRPGEDQLAGRVSHTCPDLPHGLDLFLGQTGLVVGPGGAGQRRRIEVALPALGPFESSDVAANRRGDGADYGRTDGETT